MPPNRTPTSFIPKQPVVEAGSAAPRGVNIVLLLTVILFLVSAALAAGVFLYTQYLKGAIDAQSASLTKAEAAFEPSLIETLTRLDSRIEEAGKLLDGHLRITPLFLLLERSTLENVRFTSFDYKIQGGEARITMKGQARSFSDVALQSNVFSKTQQIKSPIFSDLNLDQSGNVIFEFSAVLDPSLLLYRNNLPAPQAALPTGAPAATSSTQTP